MTAITPACAHAYQATCLTRLIPAVQNQRFRPAECQSQISASPQHSFHTDGGTRLADGETLAGWSAVARSPHGRTDIVFGPVITTEAHLTFAGARIHSNNTAEMSAMIEALSFLGPRGPVARDANSCVFLWLRTCCWYLLGHDSGSQLLLLKHE